MAETVPEVAGARPPAVALEGVTKTFGQVVALRGVSLTVADGEFVCFLGPSGCGKTTLLRIIAGLERQNAGAVRMLGRDVSSLPPSQRNYGIVFQSPVLFPWRSVLGNVLLEVDGPDRLRLAATDLYLAVSGHIAARVDKGGSIAVGARDLFERVKMMPEGQLAISTTEGSATTLKSRTSVSASQTWQASPRPS